MGFEGFESLFKTMGKNLSAVFQKDPALMVRSPERPPGRWPRACVSALSCGLCVACQGLDISSV